MTPAEFRRIALAMPAAVESAHMGHPDFRVAGKIFATLFPRDDRTWGMVKLKPEQQRLLVSAQSDLLSAVPGGWGRGGATQVRLGGRANADQKRAVRAAMIAAWRNVAPKKLVEDQDPAE